MGDAAHLITASALAMQTCASTTPMLEIFRIEHLFPAAGAGSFPDAKCGRVPCSATAHVGNHQPASAVPLLGKEGACTHLQKQVSLYFLLAIGTKHVFYVKSQQQSQSAAREGVHGGTPSLHSTAVRSHLPHGAAPLEHCLTGCPHFHSQGSFVLWVLALVL